MESSSLNFFDNVKAEKAHAMRRYNRLRTIANLFRVAELFAAAVLLSWSFSRLPSAARCFLHYLLLLSGVVSSPLFVFLLCNVIIASLYFKSRHVTITTEAAAVDPFYGEIVHKSPESGNDVIDNTTQKEEEVVYQDKEIISEVVQKAEPEAEPETESDSVAIRRTKSEKFEKPVPAKLQRSDTDVCRKMVKSGEEALSNEEFQRAIEAFIEKQKRFRHEEESLAIVLQNDQSS